MKRWFPIVAAAFLLAGCNNSNDQQPAAAQPGVDTSSSSSPADEKPVVEPQVASTESESSAQPAPAAETSAADGASGPAAGAAQPVSREQVIALMKKDNCTACHAIDKKLVGPSYQQVAAKYKDDPAAEQKLIDKVVKGGSGVWGPIPMPPHPGVPKEDIKAVVDWILAGAN